MKRLILYFALCVAVIIEAFGVFNVGLNLNYIGAGIVFCDCCYMLYQMLKPRQIES